MSSSEGKLTDTPIISQPVLHTTTADGEQSLDSEKIFNLLESLLPLEVCLHYQVLPLELHNHQLLLGMVYPEDDAALDYIDRIVSYLNCTINIQAIAVNKHQEILSAYLRYKNTATNNFPIPQPENLQVSEQLSISTDTEEDCVILAFQPIQTPIQTNEPELDADAINHWTDPTESITTPITHIDTEITQLQGNNTILQSANIAKVQEKLAKELPVLSLPLPEELHPMEILPTLTPKQLLLELLVRTLTSGIGRLYLARQPYTGKISWSNNGVLQSVLEKLPLSTYQGVLNELKRFGSLSITTIEAPRQIEKEYLYQNNRLLLRLRIMPGEHGEEATLQVLKGAALQFYHQRQIERLSNDSLRITQQLSGKLRQLQNRLMLNSNSQSDQLTALNNLNQLIDKLDYQIKILSIPSEG